MTRWAIFRIAAAWVMIAVVVPRSRLISVEHFKDLDAGLRVERAGGFVAEQHVGALGDGPRDGDALLFAARDLGGEVVHPVGEADAGQRLGRVHGVARRRR